MPIPKPSPSEREDVFMKRCMSDPVMRKEYPADDQRAAICHGQWDKRKKGSNEKDFSKIPASACILHIGEFEIGDNGEKAKTAPVKLVARTGKPIEHWFWGRVVHDLSGMHVHKSRIPIDYVHDSKEVIGYLNKFDTESGDLITSGALVPFKESDRATEIIHKNRAGVPYEASINFGGDGIKIEEIAENHIAHVNGYNFEGPGIIIRDWPLRGVAICPYGADANTRSLVFNENEKIFSAAIVSAPEATMKEKINMNKSVEVEAGAVKSAAEQLENTPITVEKPNAEATAVEATQPVAVESAPVEAPKQEVKIEKTPEAKKELSREDFARIADEFGNDIAAQIMREGGDYSAALALFATAMKNENKTLRAQIAEIKKPEAGTPVAMTVAKTKAKLFHTGK